MGKTWAEYDSDKIFFAQKNLLATAGTGKYTFFRTRIPDVAFFGSFILSHIEQVSWLKDLYRGFTFSQHLLQWYVETGLPFYSDRIAQDFHLIPFSRRHKIIHSYRQALNLLFHYSVSG